LLVLAAACGSLALGTAQASTVPAPNGARAAASRVGVSSVGRTLSLTLSPAPDDFALAEVRFGRAGHGQSISGSSLQVAVRGPFGDDYLAVATPRFRTPGGPRALVLIVNRPSALLDPVLVRLQLTARRALGTPLVRHQADPLTRPHTGPRPALCDLPRHGSALSTSELRSLRSRGQALTGFGEASAVAQAYDVVCGLPHASSFVQAVRPPTPPLPTPPLPAPPEPQPPGCTACAPAPGYACPLAEPSLCRGPLAAGARRAAAGAH
jgi:hypothetical protein